MKLERRRANTVPKRWQREEEDVLLRYLRDGNESSGGFSRIFPGRTLPGIKNKIRKLKIKYGYFGRTHVSEKERFTGKVVDSVRPKAVFEAYAGTGGQTFEWIKVADRVYAAEIGKWKAREFVSMVRRNEFYEIPSLWEGWKLFRKGEKELYFFAGDAIAAAAWLKVSKIQVDIIDLDICGTTIPVSPIFLLLLRPNHLVITHGEFHLLRYGREDALRRLFNHRDICASPLPMDISTMAGELDKALKVAALRATNETSKSFWLQLLNEAWMGKGFHGVLRRHYQVVKGPASADCINELTGIS